MYHLVFKGEFVCMMRLYKVFSHIVYTVCVCVYVCVCVSVSHLWVGVFPWQVSEVAEDLALHVVLQGGEPGSGLLIHRVMQLLQLC